MECLPLIVQGITFFLLGILANYLYTYKTRSSFSFYKMAAFREEVRAILDEARMNTQAVNAILLHAHNGGAPLRGNTFLKSSILVESPEFEEVSAFESWQNRVLDREYQNILAEVEVHPFTIIQTEKLKGTLFAVYIAYSVRGSVIFKIYSKTELSFFYASFPTRGDVKDFRFSKDYAAILTAVSRLSNVCEKYHKQGLFQ